MHYAFCQLYFININENYAIDLFLKGLVYSKINIILFSHLYVITKLSSL